MIKLPRLIIIVVILCITAAFANYTYQNPNTPHYQLFQKKFALQHQKLLQLK